MFYITTAITYTNGSPHLGHAYEAIITDIIARYNRNLGKDVYFLTGTDEHGQKISDTAERLGFTPKEMCDKYSEEIKELYEDLHISYDRFMRTTNEDHETCCIWLWKKTLANGDIYLDHYEGWYDVKGESFITEQQAEEWNYKNPITGRDLTKYSEPSYFFRMSKYKDQLLKHIIENVDFIQPLKLRNNILKRLGEQPLHDLSISRTNFNWGIKVPGDEQHVMYVWYDALTNYLTGVGYPDNELSKYWPADVHIIGKDIIWFHAVIWPCMLISADIHLPRKIFGHGFVLDKDAVAMSTSLGNVIPPYDVLDQYNSDTIRYFIARSYFGNDLKWDYELLEARHDADLSDNFGNLVRRVLCLCREFDCMIPDATATQIFDLDDLKDNIRNHFNTFHVNLAVQSLLDASTVTNLYLAEQEPWKIKGNDALELKAPIIRTVLEAIYILANFFDCIIPNTSKILFRYLGTRPVSIVDLTWNNLEAGTVVEVGGPLFPKFRPNRN